MVHILPTGYQMYLQHDIAQNKQVITLDFNVKQMNKNKFKLSSQGSVSDPLLKNMGIVMC